MKFALTTTFSGLVSLAVSGAALAHGDHSLPGAAAEHGILAVPVIVFLYAVAACALIANRYFARIFRTPKR